MNYKLANGIEMRKESGNTITLLFSQKGFEILHQDRRGQMNTIVIEHLFLQKGLEILHLERRGLMNTIVIEHFDSLLFHKSEPADKETYQIKIHSAPTTLASNY